MARRRALGAATRTVVLHECGYKCSNPVCRMVLTLDVHHIEYFSEGGGDGPENLLALCPNCHALHHRGSIPRDSLRAWKLLLIALNEGFDRRSIDALLALDMRDWLMISGDGLLTCASLLTSGLVEVEEQTEVIETTQSDFFGHGVTKEDRVTGYRIVLSKKGRIFVEAWKRGDQKAAVGASTIGNIRRPR